MVAIFYFSSRSDPLAFLPADTGSGIIEILFPFVEYFGLGILMLLALSPKSPAITSQASGRQVLATRSWNAAALSLAYAISDELHQQFVPGRSFQLRDIALDATGIAAAFALMWIWNRP